MLHAVYPLASAVAHIVAILALLLPRLFFSPITQNFKAAAPPIPLRSSVSSPDLDDENEEPALFLPLVAFGHDHASPPGPDLALTKTDHTAAVEPGDVITYTLAYQNLGPLAATGVVLTETLPANTTITPASLSAGWQQVGSTHRYTFPVGSLAPAAGGQKTFSVVVSSSLPTGVTSIVNTAAVYDDGAQGNDPQVSNNFASETTFIQFPQGVPDLALVKSAGSQSVTPGQLLAYTLEYANHGSASASNVLVTETLPQHSVFNPAASTPGWQRIGQTGQYTFSVGDLAPATGGELSFAISAAASFPAGVSSIVNTASIADDGTSGPDPDPSDNIGAFSLPLHAAPDLSIAAAGVENLFPGQPSVYSLTYANIGSQGAANVTLSAHLPLFASLDAGLSTPGWSPGSLPGEFRFSLGSLPAGHASSATLALIVDSPLASGIDSLPILFAITDDAANGVDPSPLNNSAPLNTPILAAPDLQLTKSDGDIPAALPGELIVYTLNYTNTGNQHASGVVLTETLPPHTTFDPVNSSPGWQPAAVENSFLFSIGDLPVGQSGAASFAVSANLSLPPDALAIQNIASISDNAANGPDLNPADNSAAASTSLELLPDLTLQISAPASALPGQTLEYSLAYSNQGYAGTTGVVITETLPLYSTFAPLSSTSGWQQVGDTDEFFYPVGALGVGQGGTVVFAVLLDASLPSGAGATSNTAVISDDGLHGTDSQPANNSASLSTSLIASPDLTLSVAASFDSVQPGVVLSYTLTYANTGNQAAAGVVLSVPLPASTTYNSLLSSPGWESPASGEPYRLIIGELPAGGSAAVTFSVTADLTFPAGLTHLTGSFEIQDDASNGADPTPADNQVSLSTILNAAPDLSLTKEDDVAASVLPGALLTYSLAYSNLGSQGATGVVLIETLPAHTAFDPVNSTSGWQAVEGTPQYLLTIGSLPAGAGGSASFAVFVASSLPDGVTGLDNSATIADDAANGDDANPVDNSATCSTSLNLPSDLSLTKSAPGIIPPGGVLVYTLTYSNLSSYVDASAVVIQETLPANAVFNPAASTPGWSALGDTGVYEFSVGSLPYGSGGSVIFAVTVADPMPSGQNFVVNSAFIIDQAASVPDPTPADNTAAASTLVSTGPTDKSGTISSNDYWSAGQGPYVVTGDLTVNVDVTLTLEPGVIVKFNSSRRITVNGTLNALGTAANPIYFTSYQDDSIGGDTNDDGSATAPHAGDWSTIFVRSSGQLNLNHAVVRYGGYSSPYYSNIHLTNNGKAVIENSLISNSGSNGIYLNNGAPSNHTVLTLRHSLVENNASTGIKLNLGSSSLSTVEITTTTIRQNGAHGFESNTVGNLTFQNNHIADNLGNAVDLRLNGGAVPDLSGTTGFGNRVNGVVLNGPFAQSGTFSYLPDLPYVVPEFGWNIDPGVTLILPPGQVIKAGSPTGTITVYGTLQSAGTLVLPVTFTSLRDDSIGGDTNDDGSATSPAAGDWSGIFVHSGGAAVLDYTSLRYGGHNSTNLLDPQALVRVASGGLLALTNSTLQHSAKYGVFVESPAHTIFNNQILHTADYGVFNGNTTVIPAVQAENNWWGSASGPYPYGSGSGIHHLTCVDPGTGQTYICAYYVDADPWIGKTD